MKHQELWLRVCFLANKCMAALSPSHLVYRVFSGFRSYEASLDDNEVPSLEMLSDIQAAFDALPLDEKRRVMNGWSITDRYPSTKEASIHATGGVVFRYAIVSAYPDKTIAFSSWDTDDGNPVPLQLQIVEGTSKQVAMQCLDNIRRIVSDRWDSMITGETVFDDEQKSGLSEQPITLKPASTKGNKAETLTAA